MPGSDGEIGAYVAKVLPGGATEQTGKILEGEQRFLCLEPRKSRSLGEFLFVNKKLDDLGALWELQVGASSLHYVLIYDL